MKKRTIIIIIIIILILLAVLGIILYNNSQKTAMKKPLEAATVWSADILSSGPSGDTLKFDNDNGSQDYFELARQGFEKGVRDAKGSLDIREILIGDTGDVQSYTRKINEVFSQNDILMTVGTLSDETTMYTSMETNFFSIPMLIPFANGNLSPDGMGTEFSVRLTPTSKKYGSFFSMLFSNYINDFLNTYVFGGKALPIVGNGVSVFFRNNFSGNETAVYITQEILDNGYDVQAYVPFSNDGLLNAVQTAWITLPDEISNSSAVIFIEEDGAPLFDIAEIIQTWTDRGLSPQFFLVGFEPIDLDQRILEAENVFFVQQHVDVASCPAGIVNRTEAMGYAAGQIMCRALQEAQKKQPEEPSGIRLWFMSEEKKREVHQEYIDLFRSNIRTALINMKDAVPCYGNVDFNADPDDHAVLELVRYTGKDQYEQVDTDVFTNFVIEKNRQQYGLY